MSFDSLGLNPDILRAIAEQGYREPTPIQQQAIPAVLEGRDLMASAQTGTGKTAGFTLPLLQHLITHQPHAKGRRPVRALILTPTRELAAQIGENVRDYSKYLNIRSLVVFGGVSINPQMMKLRGGVDVLVATPGRLLDLEHQNAVKLDQIEILVLDEADRMLDMGLHSRHSSRAGETAGEASESAVLRHVLRRHQSACRKAVAQPAGNRSGAPQHGLRAGNAARALCR